MTADRRAELQNIGQEAKLTEETTRRAALVKKVNAVIFRQMNRTVIFKANVPMFQHVTDAVIDLIRAEVLEEAARVFDDMWGGMTPDEVAAAIRALAAPSGALKGDT